MSVFFAILLFSLLIFLHELGHFVVAKLSKVQVNEFSMFMGPAIWKKQIGETLYSIRCIPIGGYCAMEGEDGDTDSPRSFRKAAWWKRLAILVAGSAMNFLTGLALLGIFFCDSEQFIVPAVSHIEEGCSLAEGDGIRVGDRILELDGERIYLYSDFQAILGMMGGEEHDLLVERGGKKVLLEDLSMQLREFSDEDGSVSMRYGFSFTLQEATFGNTLRYIWNNAKDFVRMVRLSLQMLLSGKAGFMDLGGPVMIVQQMSEVTQQAPSFYYAAMDLMYLGAFIAINIAVMNMLPIPALDGGRVAGLLITCLVEKIIRRKIDPKYEGYIHAVGMILLLILMAAVMFKDIFVWIRG